MHVLDIARDSLQITVQHKTLLGDKLADLADN